MPSPLAALHSRIERNWACHESPQYEARLENIQAYPIVPLRVLDAGLLRLAQQYPEQVGRLIKRSLPEDGSQRLHGADSSRTAITDGLMIQRINRPSNHMSEAERQELAAQHNADQEVLAQHLGGILLPQDCYVGPNPLRPRRRAVVYLQRYFEAEPVKIFHPHKPIVSAERLEKQEARHPGLSADLHQFALGGLGMMAHDKTMLLDCSGLGNVVTVDGQLQYTDGIYHSGKPVDLRRIGGQLEQLAEMTR